LAGGLVGETRFLLCLNAGVALDFLRAVEFSIVWKSIVYIKNDIALDRAIM
jgi:hypothetical protein